MAPMKVQLVAIDIDFEGEEPSGGWWLGTSWC